MHTIFDRSGQCIQEKREEHDENARLTTITIDTLQNRMERLPTCPRPDKTKMLGT